MKNLWDIFIRGLALAWFTSFCYGFRVGNPLMKEWFDSGAKASDAALIFKRLPPLTMPITSVDILQAIRAFDMVGIPGTFGTGKASSNNNLSIGESTLDASDRFDLPLLMTGRVFIFISVILLLIGGFSYLGGRGLHGMIIVALSVVAAFQLMYIFSFVRLILRLKTRDHYLFNRIPWEVAALFVDLLIPITDMVSFGVNDFEGSLWPYVLLTVAIVFILLIGLSAIALWFENFVTELRRNA